MMMKIILKFVIIRLIFFWRGGQVGVGLVGRKKERGYSYFIKKSSIITLQHTNTHTHTHPHTPTHTKIYTPFTHQSEGAITDFYEDVLRKFVENNKKSIFFWIFFEDLQFACG